MFLFVNNMSSVQSNMKGVLENLKQCYPEIAKIIKGLIEIEPTKRIINNVLQIDL